jgi:hypothetical protein
MFSLLVLAATMIAAVGLSGLIITSLQQTKTLDRATVAYYAAESAVERAVYEVRRPEAADAPWPLSVPHPSNPGLTEIRMPNDSAWTRDVDIEEEEIRLAIPENSFFEINLFEPSEPLGKLSGINPDYADIARLQVTWGEEGVICDPLGGVCPKLHAEWVRWDANDLGVDDSIQVFSQLYLANGIETVMVPPLVGDLSISLDRLAGVEGVTEPLKLDDYAYRLRLRAEGGDLRDVTIRAINTFGDQVPIPGRIKVEAYGKYAGITQKLTVRVPRRSPLSSLFNFVVFSQCSLVKGYSISCPN